MASLQQIKYLDLLSLAVKFMTVLRRKQLYCLHSITTNIVLGDHKMQCIPSVLDVIKADVHDTMKCKATEKLSRQSK